MCHVKDDATTVPFGVTMSTTVEGVVKNQILKPKKSRVKLSRVETIPCSEEEPIKGDKRSAT